MRKLTLWRMNLSVRVVHLQLHTTSLKCATLFITGSKDLKPVGDVHICVQVCVDTRGQPGCCSS